MPTPDPGSATGPRNGSVAGPLTEPVLVAGLGNPGPDYAGNRHNVGFAVVELLAARDGGRFASHKSRAEICPARVEGIRAVLAKPRTFMNASGDAVAGLARYYRIDASSVVVVHDELDLPFGTIRLKLGGGDNGHNGLRSVTASLSTRDYLRVRVGIGRPPGRQDPADFVLRSFSTVERRELPLVLEQAADATALLLNHGLEAARNRVHAT
ncbi:MAG: aminoacyl-tRNA hydrolase [Geodermatophilaceae bacterium]|nr:aminoacyl-tRNA hydrolase [Geodermatophilaceae bacterium]